MEREQHKPDAVVRVNDFDITVHRRGQGLYISVHRDEQEVGFFGISGAAPGAFENTQEEVAPLTTLAPSLASSERTDVNKPVKIVGEIAEIEGMTQTPETHQPVFRFTVQEPTGERKTIAAFRVIGQTLADPATKFVLGQPISMIAWDHVKDTGSFYPSQVEYQGKTITNPKIQKRR